jgi:hypothetical protein
MSEYDEDFAGVDDREFPTGVSHIQSHRVPPVEQVVKHVPGPFIPFVGGGASAFHGVMPTEHSYRNDEFDKAERQATLPAQYEAIPVQLDPVPVFIVPPEAGPEPFLAWRTVKETVTASAVTQILGKDSRRSRMTVRNEATDIADTVRIGAKREDPAMCGFLIPAGAEREIVSQGELYAIATAGDATISVIVEYAVNS